MSNRVWFLFIRLAQNSWERYKFVTRWLNHVQSPDILKKFCHWDTTRAMLLNWHGKICPRCYLPIHPTRARESLNKRIFYIIRNRVQVLLSRFGICFHLSFPYERVPGLIQFIVQTDANKNGDALRYMCQMKDFVLCLSLSIPYTISSDLLLTRIFCHKFPVNHCGWLSV